MQIRTMICGAAVDKIPTNQHVFLAFTNPVTGREEDFNAWYDQAHVPELLHYGKGFSGGRRYRLRSAAGVPPLSPWQYLALYVLEIDDPASLSKSWIVDGSPRMTPFTGLLHDDHAGWIYTPCNPRPARAYSAPFLSLDWSRTCTAATGFVLADVQRGNQQESPWKGLVIRELTVPTDPTPEACDARWCFEGLGRYRSREEVVRSRTSETQRST
jgi:hypothetical protein